MDIDENTHSVFSTLIKALSDLNHVRGPALEQLIEYRRSPNFCSILFTLINDDKIELNARILSSIEVKNTVKEYWSNISSTEFVFSYYINFTRSHNYKKSYLISENEKEYIKDEIFNSISLVPYSVCEHLSLTISYIVLSDYPTSDSQLFKLMIEKFNQYSNIQSAYINHILMLYHSIHTICTLTKLDEYDAYDAESVFTKEYNHKMDYFKNDVIQLLQLIIPLWNRYNDEWMSYLDNNSKESISTSMNNSITRGSLLLLKSISKIFEIYTIYIHSEDSSLVDTTIEDIILKYQYFMNVCKSLADNQSHILYKYTNTLYKFILKIQEKYPITFINHLESSMTYFLKEFETWNDGWRGNRFLELHLVNTINFLSNIFDCDEYKDPIETTQKYYSHRKGKDLEQLEEEKVIYAKKILEELITDEYFVSLLHTLIGRYIKLSYHDLELWEKNPEEFINEEISDDSDTSILASADLLMYRLMRYHSYLLASEILRLTHTTYQLCDKVPQHVSIDDILLKDACYASLVLGYSALSDRIKFKELFQLFKNDIKVVDTRYKLIRKRIAMIISQWVMDIPQSMYKEVFDLLIYLMNDTDIIVRLNTVIAVNNLISEMDFDYELFEENIKISINTTLKLVNEMKESNTAKQILELTARLVKSLKLHIVNYVDIILQSCSALWSECTNTNRHLLKGSIVSILSALAESIPDINPIKDTLLHICKLSTDLGNSESSFLLEEGLKLWYTLVQKSSENNSDIMNLYERLNTIYQLYSYDKNVISLTIRILDAYLMVGGPTFFSAYGQNFISIIHDLVSNSKPTNLPLINDVLINLIQIYPIDAPIALYEVFKMIFQVLKSSTKQRLTESCCTLFICLAIFNTQFFDSFFNDNSIDDGNYAKIIEIFIKNVDSINYLEKEKNWLMGFICIIPSVSINYKDLLPALIDRCVSLILKIQSQENSSRSYLYKEKKSTMMIKGSNADMKRKELKKAMPYALSILQLEDHFIESLKQIPNDIINSLLDKFDERTMNYLNKSRI